ncbi:hypothetical protein Bca101_037067 [Brassica carinata]
MSSRKGSSKRNSSSHSSSGESSANEVIAPKEEFEVEEEAKDAYYKALCGSPPPSQDIPIPKRPPNEPLTPSMVSPDYLTTLRDFYQIPSGVVFRIPKMKRRAAVFATEFKSFKDAQKFVGDFRECCGSVATLYVSQNEDFSFPAEVAEMSGLMNGCVHAESLVPPIEGRVRQLWDSIEVSEDTVEAGTGVGDEGAGVADGEVDQPVSSFGISMSGFLDFEL